MTDKLEKAIEFASVRRNLQRNFVFKPRQLEAIEQITKGKDCLVVLPTGYGKSVIYQVLPDIIDFINDMPAKKSIIVVVSPLDSLIQDQLAKLKDTEINATQLASGNSIHELRDCQIIFAHPELVVDDKAIREVFLSLEFQQRVAAVVVDEAHCIVDWGCDFRPCYGKLGCLAAIFPTCPILALTATATRRYQQQIIQSLQMKSPCICIENPDRINIFYKVIQRPSYSVMTNQEQLETILQPLVEELRVKRENMPLTVIYCKMEMCAICYAFMDRALGESQYSPLTSRRPEDRLFAQFHSPQTTKMKEEILCNVTSTHGKQRVLFVTIAFGMGVDAPNIRRVIHFGVPRKVEHFCQETGRAGRDGHASTAITYYNNNDIASNITGLDPVVKDFCKNADNKCRRSILLYYFGFEKKIKDMSPHDCCDVCLTSCKCNSCQKKRKGIQRRDGQSSNSTDDVEMKLSLTDIQLAIFRKQLIEYRSNLGQELGVSDCLDMCTGFTMDLVDEICEQYSSFNSVEDVVMNIPVWKTEHAQAIFHILQEVSRK